MERAPVFGLKDAAITGGALLATLLTAALVVLDGVLPSAFTVLFFLPIVVVSYRQPLIVGVGLAVIASVSSSPAMAVFGVRVNDSVMPLLWLGWPAVYLFLALILNQLASIQQQREQLERTERHLDEISTRNSRREQELETLSAIHTTILAGTDESSVITDITRRVAEVCGAKICTITMPIGTTAQRPFLATGFPEDVFNRFFPDGAPYGEGVDGWAMLHRRPATAVNVFEDPRYERTRDFAALVGYVSAAAVPMALDEDVHGALMVCYPQEREFSAEEITRLDRLARQTEIAIRSVRQRETLSRFAFETALALTEAIESRDPYTGGHCRRLAEYAGLVAEKLVLPAHDAEVIRLGAALHDMGKIVVPDSILKKPDKLTPEEYAIVKQHCYSGGQICKRVGFLMNAYPIVYHHHERFDGKGYPDGLRGERIPIGARIVAVVDAYDAMTTDRPYRAAMEFAEVEDILRTGAGRQWDPHIVNVFLQTVKEYGDPHDEHFQITEDGLVIPPAKR